MMHYKMDELLLLEMITYFTTKEPLKNILDTNAKTIAEYVNEIDLDKIIDGSEFIISFFKSKIIERQIISKKFKWLTLFSSSFSFKVLSLEFFWKVNSTNS